MADRMLNMTAGPQTMELGGRRRLRLLTAMEVLEARREAADLAADHRERALCANACLLARALEQDGGPQFASGREVLERLRVEEIAELSKIWRRFDREVNPSPADGAEEIETLKKAWGTRLMSAFAGACSTLFGRCPPRNGRGR